MDKEEDWKFTLWFLVPLVAVAIFIAGAEMSRIVHEMDKEIIQLQKSAQLQACQKVIAGEMYK